MPGSSSQNCAICRARVEHRVHLADEGGRAVGRGRRDRAQERVVARHEPGLPEADRAADAGLVGERGRLPVLVAREGALGEAGRAVVVAVAVRERELRDLVPERSRLDEVARVRDAGDRLRAQRLAREVGERARRLVREEVGQDDLRRAGDRRARGRVRAPAGHLHERLDPPVEPPRRRPAALRVREPRVVGGDERVLHRRGEQADDTRCGCHARAVVDDHLELFLHPRHDGGLLHPLRDERALGRGAAPLVGEQRAQVALRLRRARRGRRPEPELVRRGEQPRLPRDRRGSRCSRGRRSGAERGREGDEGEGPATRHTLGSFNVTRRFSLSFV